MDFVTPHPRNHATSPLGIKYPISGTRGNGNLRRGLRGFLLGIMVIIPGVIAIGAETANPLPDAPLKPGSVTPEGRFEKPSVIPLADLPQQAMSPEHLRFTVDLDKLLQPHDMVWDRGLPSSWHDGAAIGNGDIGALIYGPPENLQIVLGKSDTWDCRNDKFDPDHFPGKDYASHRQTYFDKDWQTHERMVTEAAVARRQKTLGLPHLTNCGVLQLRLDGGLRTGAVKMRVQLKDGVAVLQYRDRTVRILTSREYDVLLVDVDRGAPDRHIPDPIVANIYGARTPLEELPWQFWRAALEGNDNAECRSDGRYYFATQRFRAGGHYTVGVTFTSFDEQQSAALPGQIVGRLSGIEDQRFQVYLTIVSSHDTDDTEAECKRRLDRAVQEGADKILAQHQGWWHNYWMRGLASVADKSVEKQYYMGLYYMGAVLQPGRQSPGLQGGLCGENFPSWCGDFHTNWNHQVIYWGLPVNNRLDLMEPFFNHYCRIAGVAEQTAREYYRMQGIRFPHAGSLGGTELTRIDCSMLGTDPCASAWIGQLFWKYYDYSRDERFLREVAYPILRDVALFHSDFVIRDTKTGKWTIAPIVHFESQRPSPSKYFLDFWGTNSSYAQALFRMGFQNAIRAARILGVDETYQRLWEDRIENLAPVPVSEQGYWDIWEAPKTPSYLQYMLTMVYPSELVSLYHGPVEWRDQALRTFEHYGTGPTFPGAMPLALIRLGQVDEAFRLSRWSEKTVNGLSDARCECMTTMSHALPDMMVLGLDGKIHLFAGLPADQPARFLSLRAPGGFLLSGEKRGTEPDYVLVQPTAAEKLKLRNPWEGPVEITDLETGRVVHELAGPDIEVDLKRGGTYQIAKKGFKGADLLKVDFAGFDTGQ